MFYIDFNIDVKNKLCLLDAKRVNNIENKSSDDF